MLNSIKELGVLAGIVKKIKFAKTPRDDYKGSYPSWVIKKYSE